MVATLLLGLESDVRKIWSDPQFGVTAKRNAQVTVQEIIAAVVLKGFIIASIQPAFYYPGEDKIYLSSYVKLKTLEGKDVARHEIVHLLGGREITRKAFVKEFGKDWQKYWKPFEEGIAEYVNISSRTKAQTPPSARGSGGLSSGYTQHYKKVKKLIASPGMGRKKVLQAFFTGRIPAAMFQRWKKIVAKP